MPKAHIYLCWQKLTLPLVQLPTSGLKGANISYSHGHRDGEKRFEPCPMAVCARFPYFLPRRSLEFWVGVLTTDSGRFYFISCRSHPVF